MDTGITMSIFPWVLVSQLCPEVIFWTVQPLATKPGNVVCWCIIMSSSVMLKTNKQWLPSKLGADLGAYIQNMTAFTISSELMILLKPNLIWCRPSYAKASVKRLVCCVQSEGHSECSKFHFSNEDILTLQRLAAENNLIIIPLVQTFGHMEVMLFWLLDTWRSCCFDFWTHGGRAVLDFWTHGGSAV